MKHINKAVSTPSAYLIIIAIAIARAFLNEVFIYPNDFAPAGVAGIATMVQYALGFKVGYFTLLINIPLLLLAYFVLKKDYVFKVFTYISVTSVANIFFRDMDFSGMEYAAGDTGEAILAAIAVGVFAGLEFSCCIMLGGSTGGTDILSAYITKKKPQYDLVWINFAINTAVAIGSFFVYGRKYTPVLLCIVYIFVSSKISDFILRGAKTAIKFEVFTSTPGAISERLMSELRHGVTVVTGKGMYFGGEVDLLICVVNKRQVVDFINIISEYPGSFAVSTAVSSTFGNFKKIK